MPLVYNNSQASAERYNSLRREYGAHFEELSIQDRSLGLAILSFSFYNFTLNDPFRSMATYDIHEALLSEEAKKCCLMLMELAFEHMTCACTALLSQLNLPHE